jgi:exopolysaccharide biosynthesis polyprenyl glycosylphosphotransferase
VKRFSVNFAIFSLLLDSVLTVMALVMAASLRPLLANLPFLQPMPEATLSPVTYIIVVVLWATIFLFASVYDPKNVYRVTDELQNVTIATSLAALVFAGILYLFFREFSRWLLILFVALDLFFLLGWRLWSRLVFRFGRLPAVEKRVLIIGAGRVGRRVGKMISGNEWMGLHLTGYLDDTQNGQRERMPVLGCVAEARKIVEGKQIDDVVIALPQRAYGQVNKLVVDLHDLPVNVRVVPDYFSLALYRASVEDFGGLPMINLRDPALNEVQRLVKRLFDLLVGGVTFIVALPLLGLTALAIKLDSSGPVFFRQQRVGENGRIFPMYKFRSMVVGAEKMQHKVNGEDANGNLIHKSEDDPRVTRIGRFLRRTSLDELPQLINVLKGDMSLVGPRPELPWLVGQYELWQRKRFAVPQGMTGWWQVNGRSDKPLHLHTEDDLYYIQNYSLWMDIYILLKTPWVVLRGKGAY